MMEIGSSVGGSGTMKRGMAKGKSGDEGRMRGHFDPWGSLRGQVRARLKNRRKGEESKERRYLAMT